MYSYCTRCRRAVLVANLVTVQGAGYGATCAAKVGDLLVQPVRRITTGRRARRADTRQLALEVSP